MDEDEYYRERANRDYRQLRDAIENWHGPLNETYDELISKSADARDQMGIADVEEFWIERFIALRKKAREDASNEFSRGFCWGVELPEPSLWLVWLDVGSSGGSWQSI